MTSMMVSALDAADLSKPALSAVRLAILTFRVKVPVVQVGAPRGHARLKMMHAVSSGPDNRSYESLPVGAAAYFALGGNRRDADAHQTLDAWVSQVLCEAWEEGEPPHESDLPVHQAYSATVKWACKGLLEPDRYEEILEVLRGLAWTAAKERLGVDLTSLADSSTNKTPGMPTEPKQGGPQRRLE